MSSSSELEVVPSTRKHASPPKLRRSGRERRAPRNVDETAAPAAPLARALESDSVMRELDVTSDGDLLGFSAREDEVDELATDDSLPIEPARAGTTAGTGPVASTSRVKLPALPAAPARAPAAPQSTSPHPLPAAGPSTAPPKPLAPAAAASRPSIRRSRTPAGRAPAPAPAQTTYSSDEADDFFGVRKPKLVARVPRAAAARTGAGRARLPSRASSRSATPRPASPAKRARAPTFHPSSSTSDSDSSTAPRRAAGALSSDDSDAPPGKGLNLPAWARGKGAVISGADRSRMANGTGRNRKRKKLGESGSEAEAAGGEASDGPGGKGKGRGDKLVVSDGEETDDSLEMALLGGSKASKHKPQPVVARSPRKRPSSWSPTPPPVRRPSPRKAPSQADRLPTAEPAQPPQHRSPRHLRPSSSPQKAPAAMHLELSSTASDEVQHAARVNDEDDDGEPLDATLAAIRSSFALSRNARAPVAGSSSPEKRGGATQDAADKVTLRLRMVFDPMRAVPEVAKRAYEREEVIELGLHEPFASLFYELSQRRTIPRADLIITHLRPTTGKQTQLYEFGTPASLSLAKGDEADLRGYTADVWAKVRNAAARAPGAAPREDEDDAELERAAAAAVATRGMAGGGNLVLDDDDSDGTDALGAAGPATPDARGFPLTLRGSRTQSLSLAVKPSTTMAQLARAYVRHDGGKADLARQARTYLEFDGERLEPGMTVAEARDEFELEGEETFEVKDPEAYRGGQGH